MVIFNIFERKYPKYFKNGIETHEYLEGVSFLAIKYQVCCSRYGTYDGAKTTKITNFKLYNISMLFIDIQIM